VTREAPARAASAGSATDLSRRVSTLGVSPTVAMAQAAAAARAAGETVLDFSLGEPESPTPRHVSNAAVSALGNNRTRYTPSAGVPELRAAVATRYKKDFKVSFAPEEVAITNGGKQALYLACQVLLNRGDEVIIPAPYWPTFSSAVRLAGGRPILVQAQEKDGFRVTARMISRATSPRTKAVILNTPCNPTGVVLDPDDLLVIGDMAQRRKFTLLYDDTYARIIFDRSDSIALQALRDAVGDRLVILGTTSKTYCMTGWRIGWLMGPKPFVDACTALITHSTQCPNAFAQVGAVEALNGPQKFVGDMLAEYRRRRDFVYGALKAIPGITCVEPAGGFYVFPNVGRYLGGSVPSAVRLAERLLTEQKVAVVPGEGFGTPGYVRLAFARPMDELKDGVSRITGFLASLRGD
jgi:aspartate aminotransferase